MPGSGAVTSAHPGGEEPASIVRIAVIIALLVS